MLLIYKQRVFKTLKNTIFQVPLDIIKASGVFKKSVILSKLNLTWNNT